MASMQNSPFKEEGFNRLAASLANLASIKVISNHHHDKDKIVMNDSFSNKLNIFIINPVKNNG